MVSKEINGWEDLNLKRIRAKWLRVVHNENDFVGFLKRQTDANKVE